MAQRNAVNTFNPSANRQQDPEYLKIVQEYIDFLDDRNDLTVNSREIDGMIADNKARLIVDVNHLRKINDNRCQQLFKNSSVEFPAFCSALKTVVSNFNDNFARSKEQFLVGLSGSFGVRHVSPRTLSARLLGGIVCLEGIVTKCSLVRPKIVRSVHYSPVTGKTIERSYNDVTGSADATSRSSYPTKDDEGNPLETEYGLCVFKDHQLFTIQELPEKAPPGQLPRSVDVLAEDDLVDECKPGDRILVAGSYRVITGKLQGYFTGNFKTVVLANYITQQNRDSVPVYSADDIKQIRKFSQRPDVFELMSKSVAPSIFGHEYVKQAILCLLLGGQEKVLPNGTRLRGDVNILLIGDPSVAKSQMLRFVLQIANIAVATTGRGSTGVGLTAAVTTDESGDRRLEAGAMVLADRGVVCIDEFDKMPEDDRTAIHEVMEQGRVTISKAGIHAKLNARCSVLAAANPVYGRYDPFKSPMDNIGMQDSLLSRFDLIFVMTDKADQQTDLILADHVVRIHRYRAPGELDGEPTRMNSGVDWLSTMIADREEAERSTVFEKFIDSWVVPINADRWSAPMYMGELLRGETPADTMFCDEVLQRQWLHNLLDNKKYDPILHGASRSKHEKIVSREFLRKYLMVAKLTNPTLTKDACTLIAEKYSDLRSQELGGNNARTQPVTARALETMIRLATAHAKCRLSKQIELRDATAACEMVEYAYFRKVEKRERKKRIREDQENEPMEVDAAEKDGDEGRNIKARVDDPDDPYNFGSQNGSQRSTRSQVKTPAAGAAAKSSRKAPEPMAEDKFTNFQKLVSEVFQKKHVTTLPEDEVIVYVNDNSQDFIFTRAEIQSGFGRMTDENKVLVADGQVFLTT